MMALVARTAEEAPQRAGATADPGAAPSADVQPAGRSLEGTQEIAQRYPRLGARARAYRPDLRRIVSESSGGTGRVA